MSVSSDALTRWWNWGRDYMVRVSRRHAHNVKQSRTLYDVRKYDRTLVHVLNGQHEEILCCWAVNLRTVFVG